MKEDKVDKINSNINKYKVKTLGIIILVMI